MNRYKDMGARLAQVRASLNLTQREFALAIGVSIPSLQNYESGARELPFGAALTISEKYDINPLWLGRGAGPPSSDEPRILLKLLSDLYVAFERGLARCQEAMPLIQRRVVWSSLVIETLKTRQLPLHTLDLLTNHLADRSNDDASAGPAETTDTHQDRAL